MGKAVRRIFAVADADLFEVLHPPQVPVLADRAQVEARHAERLGADLGVPAVEPAEVEIGRSVGQPPGFDRVEIIDQKQEDVAIRRIERGRILRDVDVRVVDPGRPVEHARNLPACVAGAVASDLLHRFDKLMVVDPAVVGAGHGAQFEAAPGNWIVGFERLDLLGSVGGQPVLQIDRGERRRKLAQIGSRSAYLAGQLPKAPVGWRHRCLGTRQHESQAFRIIAVCFDMDQRRLDHARPAPVRPTAH